MPAAPVASLGESFDSFFDAVASFVADLPPVRVDARGEAAFTWEPDGPLTPGDYGLWLENGPPECQTEGGACRFFTLPG